MLLILSIVKNNGEVELDYDAVLEITGAAKSADEATRVMIYKNGKSSIYGKGQYKDRSKAETDCTKFVSDKEVYKTSTEKFKVGDIDKYTIVIWIEGNDPECIDDIRNGHVRMRMLFSVRDDEESTAKTVIFGTVLHQLGIMCLGTDIAKKSLWCFRDKKLFYLGGISL
mgnify:CR=1 FL=1